MYNCAHCLRSCQPFNKALNMLYGCKYVQWLSRVFDMVCSQCVVKCAPLRIWISLCVCIVFLNVLIQLFYVLYVLFLNSLIWLSQRLV